MPFHYNKYGIANDNLKNIPSQIFSPRSELSAIIRSRKSSEDFLDDDKLSSNEMHPCSTMAEEFDSETNKDKKVKSIKVKVNQKTKGWIDFKEITLDKYESFKYEWKIRVDNSRKNSKDTTFYLSCKFEKCPVKYKTHIPFKSNIDEKIIISYKTPIIMKPRVENNSQSWLARRG